MPKNITWSGEKISSEKVIFLDKKKIGSVIYFSILLYQEKYWVIKQKIKDPRFILTKKLESFLQIKQLGYIIMDDYVLYKSKNPNVSPELTLNNFLKKLKERKASVPIHVKNQIRLIYSFRFLFGLSQNNNSSLCIRKTGHNYTVYNLKFNFGIQRANLSNSIINFWFIDSTENHDIFEESILRLICGKNNVSKKEFSLFRKKLDKQFTKLLRKSPDLVWFQSQIINYLIETI